MVAYCKPSIALLLLALISSDADSHARQKRIVGGRPAAVPQEDEPLVYVYKEGREARVSGTKESTKSGKNFYAFRGLRFAEPPVGRFRFQRPRRMYLEGNVNGTTPGPPCPQPAPGNEGTIVGSEDCLYLNVYTPKNSLLAKTNTVVYGEPSPLPRVDYGSSGNGYPVMFWIHGGAYRKGSASQYDPGRLVEKGVVVVTTQYRLGSLGFLSAGVEELPGNVGMFDLVVALEWVKDYIEFFGGNPKTIIPFGQDTGASCAFFLAISKVTKGFFSALIAMSGTALSAFALDKDPFGTAKSIAEQNDCPTTPVNEMVRCLQELDVDKIIQADSGLQALRLAAQGFVGAVTGLLGPAPVVEGNDDGRFLPSFLTETPMDSLKAGKFPDIPLITGVTKDETARKTGDYQDDILNKFASIPNYFDQELLPNLVKHSGLFNGTDVITGVVSSYFQQQPQGDAKYVLRKIKEVTTDALYNFPAFLTMNFWTKKAPAYLYSFVGPSGDESKEVEHGDDVTYLFDLRSLDGDSEEGRELNEEDLAVQDVTTTLFTNFAKDNIPSQSWSPFTEGNSDYLVISENPQTESGFRYCEMAAWGQVLSRLQTPFCEAARSLGSGLEDVGSMAGRGGGALGDFGSSLAGGGGDFLGAAGNQSGGSIFGGAFQPIVGDSETHDSSPNASTVLPVSRPDATPDSPVLEENLVETEEHSVTTHKTSTEVPTTPQGLPHLVKPINPIDSLGLGFG